MHFTYEMNLWMTNSGTSLSGQKLTELKNHLNIYCKTAMG